MAFDLEQLGKTCTYMIKSAPWFPYKSGHLRDDATEGVLITDSTFCITFNSDVAEYIPYLEEGTSPHDIPKAFGRDSPFGIGGRFDGKFHSGSTKHKGFISEKSVNTIVNYIIWRYNGTLADE